jgi:hypothetical protein
MSPHSLDFRLTTYLTLRKGLGMELGAESTVLADFVKFVGDQETTGAVTTKMVFDWLDATRDRQHRPVASRRLSVVRQFLLHLSAADRGNGPEVHHDVESAGQVRRGERLSLREGAGPGRVPGVPGILGLYRGRAQGSPNSPGVRLRLFEGRGAKNRPQPRNAIQFSMFDRDVITSGATRRLGVS